MKTITTEIIMSHRPCDDYPESRVKSLIGNGKTPLEILDLLIPSRDRIWVLTRHGVLPDQILHEFALLCAESVLHIYEGRYPDDRRPRNAMIAKRRWLEGEITDIELSDAARAAEAAARAADVARAAARAARAAADAARAAAWAADAAEQEKQIEFLRGLLQCG